MGQRTIQAHIAESIGSIRSVSPERHERLLKALSTHLVPDLGKKDR